MSEKTLKTRIKNKSALPSDWSKATNFKPLDSEFIVYKAEGEDFSYPRFKIGDGIHNVNELPFADDEVRDLISDKFDEVKDNLDAHTSNSDIHFTTDEKTKLSGIETGAQKNTVTGVKGDSETSYRTGNINITKANIGLSNVDNTSDANKPVSTAQQSAIDSALASANEYTDTKTANFISDSAVDSKISAHNTSISAHNDLRNLIADLSTKVNNFLDVDDATSDQLSEVLALIESNKDTLDSITSSKINVKDIVDNLTTASATKVLSANQGVAIKALIDALQEEVNGKADSSHAHDDHYYTESEIDSKISIINTSISNIANGTTKVSNATHADSADEANHATSADSAITANSATKASQDGNGKVIVDTYETKTDASAKLTEAKEYADSKVTGLASTSSVTSAISTHNTSSDAHSDIRKTLAEVKEDVDVFFKDATISTDAKDTLKEIQDYITSDASVAAEMTASIANKADKVHSHAISDVTNLQSTLDAKATLTNLDTHTSDSNIHVTTINKLNWNSAYDHSQDTHAPSNAQANIIESIKVNGTVQTITSKAVNITVPTKASDIEAAPTSHTHIISDIANLQTTLSTLTNEVKSYTDTAFEESKAFCVTLSDSGNGLDKTFDEIYEAWQDGKSVFCKLNYDGISLIAPLLMINDGQMAFIAQIGNTFFGVMLNSDNEVMVELIETTLKNEFEEHTNNTNNPHNITKYQIGLGNVNNTSDMDKPVSAAQQDAINEAVQEISNNFEAVIGLMYNNGEDVDDNGVPLAIRTIASDEASTALNEAKAYTDTEVAKKANSSHTHSSYENQNAFSNIAVNGQTTIAADIATDTLTLTGSNVTITTDATNNKVTISVADGTTNAKGIVQLIDSTESTSTTTAATPNSVKTAYDLAKSADLNAVSAITKANTAISTADNALASAYAYTDEKIDALVGEGASDTLDTIGEISAAIEGNQDMLDTLNDAIGNKANSSDLTSHTGNKSNPHGVTKTQIGLGSVENKSSATIRGELTKDDVTTALGYTPPTSDTKYTLPQASSTTLGGVKSGGDVTITDGIIAVNDDSHNHTISNITGLQTVLNGKADSSHGTHVSYSTTAPAMDGTASVGTASTVARGDHIHPTDTSRAAQADLASHTGNTTSHITSTERADWNNAKTHAGSAHAPSNAQANQNAFSNVTVGTTTIAADTTTDTLTLVAGSNITLTPDATNDKITIAATDTIYTHPTSHPASMITGLSSVATSGSYNDLSNKPTIPSAYTHPTSSGNKHIPSGGSSGQILRWSADGTAVWGADNNTTYGVVSTTADGLAPKRDGSTTKYLRADGTWAVPPDTNTVYTHPTYTARTGVPTANATPAFGGTFSVNQITSDGTGHVTAATSRTITIPSTLSNGTGTAGLIKTTSTVTSASGYTACPVISGVPYYKDTNTTYSLSSFGITATAAELNYMDGVTSNVQTQLDDLSELDEEILDICLNLSSNVTSIKDNLQSQINGKAASDHTHSAATTSANGLMTAAMVTKLNGIATGANAYTLPTASSSTLGGVKTTSTVTSTSGLTACPIISGVPYYKDTNTTYTSLKNPYALTIQGNGTTLTNGTYDGSAAKTVNITPASIGAAASSHTHSYLPLTGGIISGNIKAMSDGNIIGKMRFDANEWIGFYSSYANADGYTNRKGYIGHSGGDTMSMINERAGYMIFQTGGAQIQFKNSNGTFYIESGIRPSSSSDNKFALGTSSSRWSAVYAGTGSIQTSDRNAKKDFTEFDERYEQLFMDLKPQLFKFKDGTSDRFHSGFISNDVEESMTNIGLTAYDFAGFCKDKKKVLKEVTEDGDEIFEDVLDENGNQMYDYSLRYQEFIALNTHMIQKQQLYINKLQEEIEMLKSLIN